MNLTLGTFVSTIFEYIPLWLDVCASADVVLGGEDKFIVEHPLRLVVQDCGGMQLDHLVVFYCEVMTCTLQMCHLQDGDKNSV